MAGEPISLTTFLIGFTCAAVLVVTVGGLALCLLGRRQQAGDSSAELEKLHGMVSNLMQWTSGVSQEVSDYKAAIHVLAAKIDPAPSLSQEPASDVLHQIVTVNEELQSRLNSAEDRLKSQADQLASYLCEARTDALTSLPNRRAFDEELARRLAEWERYGTETSVILIDVDKFKSVNDRFGHLAGDAVLQHVSEALREVVRDADFVARYGGEEFAVILPNTDSSDAHQSAERLRRSVEQLHFQYDEQRLRVTVSCGVATAQSDDSSESLLNRADIALYAAKTSGRNNSQAHDGRQCHRITPPPLPRIPESDSPTPLPNLVSEELGELCKDLRRRLVEVIEQ